MSLLSAPRKTSNGTYLLACAFGLACVALVGCGQGGPPRRVIYGNVDCGGEKVPTGQLAFVPVEGGTGPAIPASIADGQYRIDVGGGVPVGKYRVEVNARKKTGRKVQRFIGVEAAMVDEEVRMGPEVYAGRQSPLVVEVSTDFDGRVDITIPGQ